MQYRTDNPTSNSEASHTTWKGPIVENISDDNSDYEPRHADETLPTATGASDVQATPTTSLQQQQEETPGWLCVIRTREERSELMRNHTAATHVSDILRFEPTDSINQKWDSLDETLQKSDNFRDPTYELPTQIEGSPELKGRILKLLEKYREYFRRTVAPEPADIPPMEIDVDVDKWETSRQSKAPLRHKSGSKDAETRRQCLGMSELDVIEASM